MMKVEELLGGCDETVVKGWKSGDDFQRKDIMMFVLCIVVIMNYRFWFGSKAVNV